MNADAIKSTTNRFVAKSKEIATSDTAKEVGKVAVVGVAGAVGLGVAYAVFVKSAQVAYSAMS
ncbi:MAG TPA: hypothetical protein PKZ27_03155 [Rhodocyclaceae bacterium]|nr:hypothetical protein [Rhodocyclaceae bacterium]